MLPDRDILIELLACDLATGRLWWKPRQPKWFEKNDRFSPEASANIWNGKNAHKEAFSRSTPHGYKVGCIFGQLALAHRVIWKIAYGSEPETIDHINGDKADNRISNLRDVSQSVQSKNKSLYQTNRHGFPGVRQLPNGKWSAAVSINRKPSHLGTFATMEDAISARKAAMQELGYHENHGRTNTAQTKTV